MKLDLGERFVILKILNERGKNLNFSGLRLAFKIVDRVELSEEERKSAGVEVHDGKTYFKNIKLEKDVDLQTDEVDLLKGMYKLCETEKTFSVSDGKPVYTLAVKLGFNGNLKE